jgi:hypothetical protein
MSIDRVTTPVQVISEVNLKSHVALVPFIRDGGFVLLAPCHLVHVTLAAVGALNALSK